MVDDLHDYLEWETDPRTKSSYQIFIKTPDGKSILLWVQASESVNQLKKNIVHILGILMPLQNLICGGKSMQDELRLQEYNIFRHPSLYKI